MNEKCLTALAAVEMKNILSELQDSIRTQNLLADRFKEIQTKAQTIAQKSRETAKKELEFALGTDKLITDTNKLFDFNIKFSDSDYNDFIKTFQTDVIDASKELLNIRGSSVAAFLSKLDPEIVTLMGAITHQTTRKYGKNGQLIRHSAVDLDEIMTRRIDKMKKLFPSNVLKDSTKDFEGKISTSFYKNIKAEGGPDGYNKYSFNTGYSQKSYDEALALYGEGAEMDAWIKANKGFIQFMDEYVKEISTLYPEMDLAKFHQHFDEYAYEVGVAFASIFTDLAKVMKIKDLKFFQYPSSHTFIDDVVSAAQGNPQFAYNTILKKRAKASDIADRWITLEEKRSGTTIGAKRKAKLLHDAARFHNVFWIRGTKGFDKFIRNTQALYYEFRYGGASFGLGHLTMMMQLVSNYKELGVHFRFMTKADEEVIAIASRRIGTTTGDMGMLGSGIHRETGLEDTTIANASKQAKKRIMTTLERAALRPLFARLEKMGYSVDSEIMMRTRNMIEQGTFDPMALDSLNDLMRKHIAIHNLHKKFGRQFMLNADENQLRALVDNEIGELGGAVTSTSQIHRTLAFTMLNPDKSYNSIAQPIMTMIKFLRGWSFSKVLRYGEIQIGTAHSLYRIITEPSGPNRAMHMANLREGIYFNIATTQAILDALVIYARFEKVNQDYEDNKFGAGEFIKDLTNQLVAFDILLGQEIENLLGIFESYGDSPVPPSVMARKLFLDYVRKTTNFMKMYSIPTHMKNYYEYHPDASITEAMMYTRRQTFYGAARYGKFVSEEALADGSYNPDPLHFFGVSPLTKGQIADNESWNTSAVLDHVEGNKTSLVGGIYDIFGKYLKPKDFWSKDDAASVFVESIIKDDRLRKLYSEGTSTYDFNELLDFSHLHLNQMWTKISYDGVGDARPGLKDNLEKEQSEADRREGKDFSWDRMESVVTDILKDKGMTIEDITNKSEKLGLEFNQNLAKLYVAMEVGDNERTKYIVPYILQKELLERERSFRKEFATSVVPEKESSAMKADILKKYSSLIDLNNEAKGTIARSHIEAYHEDKYDGMSGDSKSKLESYVGQHIDNMLLATANLPDSGTDVAYLTSRIRLNLQFMNPKTPEGRQVYANYVNDTLARIEYSSLPDKEKLARQAAFILGMTKTGTDIMSDSKKYGELSREAKVQLANWHYKVSSDTQAYAQEVMSGIEKDAAGYAGYQKEKKSFFPSVLRPKSPYLSGQRPGFGKPMAQSPMPSHAAPYVNPNSEDALHANLRSRAPKLIARPIQMPLLKEIQTEMLRVMFESIYSKDVFKTMSFEEGDPITKRIRTSATKRKAPQNRKKKIAQNKKGRVSLNENLASYTDLIR